MARRKNAPPRRPAGKAWQLIPCHWPLEAGGSARSTSGIPMGGHLMPHTRRLGTPEAADRCGTICYAAFKTIAAHHQFPTDFPSPAVAAASFASWLSHPEYAVVL